KLAFTTRTRFREKPPRASIGNAALPTTAPFGAWLHVAPLLAVRNASKSWFWRHAKDVRFWSRADICAAKRHGRVTPNSDHENGPQQTVMSPLPPKADVCGAVPHMRALGQ